MADNKKFEIVITSEFSRRLWDIPKQTKSRMKRGENAIEGLGYLDFCLNHKNNDIALLAREIVPSIEKEIKEVQSFYEEKAVSLQSELDEYIADKPFIDSKKFKKFKRKRKLPERSRSGLVYNFMLAYMAYDKASHILEKHRQAGKLTIDNHKPEQYDLAKRMRSFIEGSTIKVIKFNKVKKALEN